jgi:hypothetical protein
MKYRLLATLMALMSFSASAENNRADYDVDDDGLIEINDLNDLNEIRNNPQGLTLYGSNYGCPATGCFGFELTKDLDFDTSGDGVFNAADSFWDGGAGWLAIPEFNAVFDGNGHVIRNLTINRPNMNNQALFGATRGASIRHLGLTDVSILAGFYLGSFVGDAQDTQINGVFSTGKIANRPGTLSTLGGIIGVVNSTTATSTRVEIANSYSLVDFGGSGYYVGGMIGETRGTSQVFIRSSFVANNSNRAMTGNLSGANITSITNSYWFGNTTRERGALFESYGVSLSQLKCPITADDTYCVPGISIYTGWASEKDSVGVPYWDFGDNQQLPGLLLNGRLHRFDVTLNASSSSSSSSSSVSSSSVSSATRSPASVPSSLRSSSSSSRSVSSCMGRSPASVPGSVSSRSSSSTSSCWNWTGPNPAVSSSSSSSSSSKKKSSSSSSSSKKKKPKHHH